MNRRTFQRGLLLSAFSTSCLLGLQEQPAEQTLAQGPAPFKLCRRGVTEYELPLTTQTHEIIRVPARPLVLVSQMSNSNLVKIWLDPQSEQVTGVQAFPLGSPNSMLHGLAVILR